MTLRVVAFALLFSGFTYGQEICNNGIDDDADGAIDLNDSSCVCGSTNAIESIIPNPSFEVNSGCPSSPSQLFLATPWIQATDATSDYFNTCGLILPAVLSVNLGSFPHGDGIAGTLFIGDWAEYLGTELLSPMVAGTNYQLTFNTACTTTRGNGTHDGTSASSFEPVNITLYGCADGSNLPLYITTCPSNSDPTWIVIGSATYTPASEWSQVTMTFTPTFDVNAIMLGAPPVLPVTYPATSHGGSYPYFVYDNLLLNEASAFGVNISQTGTFCTNNLVLMANVTVPVSPQVTYQWYRNGVAIVGATSPNYSIATIPDNLGQYSVMVTDGNTCYTSSSNTVNNTVPGPEATSIQPTCIVTTGSITVTTPAAQYSFDNGENWQNSPTQSGLAVGPYFIKIQTANGCISSVTGVGIVPPQMLSNGNIDVTHPETCDGTGSITVNAPTAVEYSFDNGVTWTTINSVTGLIPGTYEVIIKDSANCQSAPQSVTISQIFFAEPTYTVVVPTCNSNGSITITTVADLYSFDDGVTWTTNNIATDLIEGIYIIKTRSGGCESYSGWIYLYADNPPPPNFVEVQPTCEDLGSITITTVASEYSFDDGATWTPNNVANGLTPGYYYIKIKDLGGCPSNTAYAYLYEPTLLTPAYTITNPFCTETTGSITIEPQANYTYSFDGGITYQSSNTSGPLLPGSYVIKVSGNIGCTSSAIYVYISDPTGIPPAPTANTSQLFCVFNSPTVADLIAQGTSLQWYGSLTETTPLPADTPLIDGATYYATQTGANTCESQDRLAVDVAVIQFDLPATDYDQLICDDLNDNDESVNLSDYENMIIVSPTDYSFSYYSTFAGADAAIAADHVTNFTNFPLVMGSNIFYVRVVASNGCWKVATLTLTMIQSPFNNMDTEYILCEGRVIPLAAPNGFDGYLWSTGQTTRTIIVNQPGNYSVTIMRNHGTVTCSTTTNITVTLSNEPTITEIETIDWTDTENTIEVHLSSAGIGDYEYSLDGVTYQDSNLFSGLESGVYTVYVRDRNLCGDDDQEVYLLTYPRFFTPNGDGFNDNWHIKFAKYEADLDVKIFDRHGKFIKELHGDGDGWDGQLNGYDLPASDYWFVVTRVNGQVHRGHFGMKR